MLAEDEIRIEIGRGSNAETVFLRPTLRAAMRLERAHGGFDKIIEAILAGNVTVMASVIRESEEHRSDIPRLIEGLAAMPLYAGVEALKEPLVKHVLQFLGSDAEEVDTKSDAEAEPVTFADHYARLFKIATGWLGWTPEVAWTATASEIIAAFKGRTEMLQAIFGGGEKAGQDDGEQSAEIFNAKLSGVLAMASARFANGGNA